MTAPSQAKPIQGTPHPRPYRYAKYPAWDAILDLLHRTGIPASHISLAEGAGRYHLSVLLPGHRFTDEYEGADLQAVAQRWLNGEADTFAEQCLATAGDTA